MNTRRTIFTMAFLGALMLLSFAINLGYVERFCSITTVRAAETYGTNFGKHQTPYTFVSRTVLYGAQPNDWAIKDDVQAWTGYEQSYNAEAIYRGPNDPFTPFLVSRTVSDFKAGSHRTVVKFREHDTLLSVTGDGPKTYVVPSPETSCATNTKQSVVGSEVLDIGGRQVPAIIITWDENMAEGPLHYKGWFASDPALGCLEVQWTYRDPNSPAAGEKTPVSLTVGEPDVKLLEEFERDHASGRLISTDRFTAVMSNVPEWQQATFHSQP